MRNQMPAPPSHTKPASATRVGRQEAGSGAGSGSGSGAGLIGVRWAEGGTAARGGGGGAGLVSGALGGLPMSSILVNRIGAAGGGAATTCTGSAGGLGAVATAFGAGSGGTSRPG